MTKFSVRRSTVYSQANGTKSTSFHTQCVWIEVELVPLACADELPRILSPRDISGSEYEWAMKMGHWPMSHTFACKNQDFDGPFGKNEGPKKP